MTEMEQKELEVLRQEIIEIKADAVMKHLNICALTERLEWVEAFLGKELNDFIESHSYEKIQNGDKQ